MTINSNQKRITVVLPLPTSEHSGHAKGSWRSKAKFTRQMKGDSERRALLTLNFDRPSHDHATLNMAFFVPDNRKRDVCNMIHGCKAYIDGIVKAGFITDDCWQVLGLGRVTVDIDRENPRVEITMESI